jgi:transposase
MKAAIEFIDMNREELNQLLERAQASLSGEDYRKVRGVVEALSYLTDLVADQQTTIRDLRDLLFPASTEKTEAVLKNAGMQGTSKTSEGKSATGTTEKQKQKTPGHGRNGASDYDNARQIKVPHATLKPGDRCPGCLKGKVYEQQEPRRLVRIVGQAPLTATIYALQCFRCNLCGAVTCKAVEYDCLTGGDLIRPCVPSHVAYEVGAGRKRSVRSPRTMYPQPQGWHQNREAMVHLPA